MSQRPTNLYKYLPPERAASVLGKLLIRFSQVSVMNDIEEFKPPISGIATETVFATMMSHNARVIVFLGYSQRAWDYFRSEFDMVLQTKSPKGIIAVGIFLFFGAVMASFAGTTLVWPGTTLDRLWTLNPRAYKELAPHTKAVGIPFLLLAVTLAVAGMGWFNVVFGDGN